MRLSRRGFLQASGATLGGLLLPNDAAAEDIQQFHLHKPIGEKQTICPYCSVGCAVNVQVKDGKVIRAVGNDEGAANEGELCVRGRFGVVDVVHSLSRLKAPQLKRNGRRVQVSWEPALDAAAQGLGQYTGDQFAAIGSATATNEENYALQKFARTVMRSNNVALSAGFLDHQGTSELMGTLKSIDGARIRDVRDAACIMVIGANVSESHPILGLEIRHATSKGAKLITVDARQTKMTKQSSVWLRPKVSTDHMLLAGIIKATGRRPSAVVDVDMAHVSDVTGVKQEDIVAAAELLAENTPAIIIYGSGVTHYPTAMDVIKAMCSLAAVVGNVKIIGVPGESNLVGAYDMGVHPALLPGYRPADTPGRTYAEILEGIRKGEIKALYVAGQVPPLPELANLEFLVVQDIVPTEVAQYAHVILPATTFAEMDGTFTSLEGRVQRVRQAIHPVGQSQPGWMILRDIMLKMGHEWNVQSAADVMAEIATVVPAYAEAAGGIGASGVLRRFETLPAQVVSFSLNGIPQFTNTQYPLTLITERNLLYYHGVCLTEEVKGMNLIKEEQVVHINPADAARLGIKDGALVQVVSPYGNAECIAYANDGMSEGSAFVSFNRVTGSPLFPGMTPDVKAMGVRIENVERGA